MKNLIYFLLLLSLTSISFATTTSTTTRALNIDGNVSGQKGATNGTNGTSWENNELLSGKSGVNWYLSWDNNNLYIGREGGNNTEPVLIYIQAEYSGSSYTDNSSGISYDGTRGDFPTTGSPNWGSGGGVNFVAYIKSGYDEFRTWNGSTWSSANTSLNPQFTVQGSTNNMEVAIPWNSVTQGNGTPSYIRIVMFHTNGNNEGSGAYVYGATPNNINTPSDGNQTVATFRSWWGGYPVVSGVEPNSGSDQPLPVELNTLNIIKTFDYILLRWSTATEVNNYGWEIERSKIDKFTQRPSTWKTIGFVKGSGNSNSPKEYSFIDKDVLYGEYAYRLKQIDIDGSSTYSEELRVFAGKKPEVYELKAYPNPFNPTTTIRFSLPEGGILKLSIYDALGRFVETLVDDQRDAGIYEFEYNASKLSSGIYFTILQVNNIRVVNKLQLIK
ncbi:MAG: T9SS type A sorting domain-containing protein [Ignavibacteria bacterium]|jgi:hypothetical protein|nr:T9SS type A sorting domain-containing protein [Ignavibacteria bacterium]MDH7527468.1 T9SS type A sorting domain-containing protein [Ignavibacteria bacterium]